MLPGNTGRRNAGARRGTTTPIGSRNLRPREPVILPIEEADEAGGGEYFGEWEYDRLARRTSSVLTDDDNDDLSEVVARARAKREQARLAAVEARAEAEAVEVAVGDTDDALDDQPTATDADDGGHHLDGASDTPAESVTLSADEVRRLERRDYLMCKRLREADKKRLREITDPAALAGESAYTVVCFGAAARHTVGKALDAYAAIYHSPFDEPLADRQARLKEAMTVVTRWRQNVARYDVWVAANRPALEDDELLGLLAGSKEDRAAAKARLAGLDRAGRAALGAKACDPTRPGPATPLPLIYRAEYQGKVRAYPEWVASVLRKAAGNRSRAVPVMAFVLAQLAYWLRPADDTGRPRAKRAKVIAGKWWVVLGYGAIEKQTPVSRGQARQAVKLLKEFNLVETMAAKDAGVGSEAGGVNFGPNTVFLRVKTEVLDPLVSESMST